MSVDEVKTAAAERRWFEHELDSRLARLEDPEYRATAEHLQPVPRNHWWWMLALAVPIPLVIALVSWFTW